jgi:predicted DCC family thiol-disulfide oxidoreductase YuxK
MKPEKSLIVLFDGDCNLCNRSVQFIIKRDITAKIKLASLQSEIAKELIKKHLPISAEINSILLLEDGKLFFKSTAALKIAIHLDGFWPILFILIIIPGFIRDYFYDVIATNRIKWFGKAASCWVEKDYKERFLS